MKTSYIAKQAAALVAAGLFSLVVFSSPAAASPVPVNINLSTGLNASGTMQSTGDASDAFWMTNGLPAKVVAPSSADWWGFWPANDVNSVWIARNPDTSANGTGTYSRVFDLTGVNLSSVSLSGQWAVDDEGSISLNGHPLATQAHDGWQQFLTHVATVDNSSSWFNQGLNTLTLTISNSDDFFEGVRFHGSLTATSLPEPGAFGMLACGAILLAAFRGIGRRRKMA